MLTEVTNESYSGDRPLSKIKARSESATGLPTAAKLSTMDLTDWMYSDITEVAILMVCSWYLNCCILARRVTQRFTPESITHHEMW